MVVKNIDRAGFTKVNKGYAFNMDGELFGLYVNNELVSVCGVRRLNWWVREVFGVYTKEEYRGNGYAGRLLERVCNEDGVVYFLTCRVDNEEMRQVVLGQMWTEVTMFRNRYTGNFLKVWCYQKGRFCGICRHRIWDSEQYIVRDDGSMVCAGCLEDLEERSEEELRRIYRTDKVVVGGRCGDTARE